jgi:hypothetical protein
MRKLFTSEPFLFRLRLALGALCVLIASAAIYILASGNRNSPKTVSPAVRRTDVAPLKKRFPFLGDFERCSWTTGVAYDGSKGRVPSPSEYFIQAYVMLDPKQTKELLNRYEWIESKSDAIPEPAYLLGEGFPNIDGPSWHSGALMRDLPSITTYSAGTILIQPEKNLLYLRLHNF